MRVRMSERAHTHTHLKPTNYHPCPYFTNLISCCSTYHYFLDSQHTDLLWPLNCSPLILVSIFALAVLLNWNTLFLDASIRFLLNVTPPQKGLPSLLFFFRFLYSISHHLKFNIYLFTCLVRISPNGMYKD